VQAILTRYDGTLLQLTIGDKGSYLYISFGALTVHENDLERAAQTALAVQALPQIFAWLPAVQIGVSAGVMRVGVYGAPSRKTYGAFGDDTNLAARLMTAAAPGEVLVAGPLWKPLAEIVACERRSAISVKGRTSPLDIFAITGHWRRRAIRLQEPQYTMPMIGRDAELALLEQLLDHSRHQQGQVIGIVGDAGLGKSRLLHEIIRIALARSTMHHY
jgi:class 3 adenylate cyclase